MPAKFDGLWQIDIGYACFGVVIIGDIVLEAPPIAQWMMYKRFRYILDWVEFKRGGTMILVTTDV